MLVHLLKMQSLSCGQGYDTIQNTIVVGGGGGGSREKRGFKENFIKDRVECPKIASVYVWTLKNFRFTKLAASKYPVPETFKAFNT